MFFVPQWGQLLYMFWTLAFMGLEGQSKYCNTIVDDV